MFARKKILGLLLITIVLCSISIRPSAAEEKEEPDVETKIEVVPVEEVSSSDDYVDSKFETVFINSDVNETTIDYAKQEFKLEYNVTFEILSIDKGTFDNATIINTTNIKFEASNVVYGTNRTGEAIIRLYGSSPLPGLVTIFIVVILIIVLIPYPLLELVTETEQTFPPDEGYPKTTQTVEDAKTGEVETETEVPEFPLGLALEILFIPVIIYILWKSKLIESYERKKGKLRARLLTLA